MAKPPARTQQPPKVTGRVAKAIRLMILEGAERPEAAALAGMRDDSLYRALRLPHVKAYRAQVLAELRSSLPERAILTSAEIMEDRSQKASDRLAAGRWLAGIEGVSPVQRTHSVHQVVGYDYGETVDITPAADPASVDDDDDS